MARVRSNPLLCIMRMDSIRTHGWQVRIKRGRKVYSKFFSDRKLGSKRKSLAAAKLWRDEVIRMRGHAKRGIQIPAKEKIPQAEKDAGIARRLMDEQYHPRIPIEGVISLATNEMERLLVCWERRGKR